MKKGVASNRKKTIDHIDCRMIELLQKDGRIPNTDIAKEIGISEATVRTRLNRLIEEGYIQIVAVSNPIKLGFKIVGVLRIKVDINKIESVTKELSKLNQSGSLFMPPVIRTFIPNLWPSLWMSSMI